MQERTEFSGRSSVDNALIVIAGPRSGADSGAFAMEQTEAAARRPGDIGGGSAMTEAGWKSVAMSRSDRT